MNVWVSLISNQILEHMNDRNSRIFTEYSIGECVGQLYHQSNIEWQEWSEWPDIDWILHWWMTEYSFDGCLVHQNQQSDIGRQESLGVLAVDWVSNCKVHASAWLAIKYGISVIIGVKELLLGIWLFWVSLFYNWISEDRNDQSGWISTGYIIGECALHNDIHSSIWASNDQSSKIFL